MKKEIVKTLEWKNLREYYDLHLKTDTLLLADAFENFRKLCQLDIGKSSSALGLAWQAYWLK